MLGICDLPLVSADPPAAPLVGSERTISLSLFDVLRLIPRLWGCDRWLREMPRTPLAEQAHHHLGDEIVRDHENH
jgi:hypothetical protein